MVALGAEVEQDNLMTTFVPTLFSCACVVLGTNVEQAK